MNLDRKGWVEGWFADTSGGWSSCYIRLDQIVRVEYEEFRTSNAVDYRVFCWMDGLRYRITVTATAADAEHAVFKLMAAIDNAC